MKNARTIAIDFDGVIHKYSKGWDDGTIYDFPVDGAFQAIKALMQDYAVFIFTTRNVYSVAHWMKQNSKIPCAPRMGIDVPDFWNEMGTILVTNKKLPALAYIDDRGIRFMNWDQAIADLYKYEGKIA